jgi:putative membrane protein
MKTIPRSHLALLATVVAVILWSGWRPYDRLTWWLEASPALAGLIILGTTYRRFRFTTLCYTLIALHICVLCVGGHYTYARVPLFNWLQPIFGWHRNHYDRLGHLMQGFVPAMIAREVLIRFEVLQRKKWLTFHVLSICLGISAFYELIEWWTALASGAAAIDFLGTQGDVWDTQWDMLMALIGSILGQAALSRLHDRQLTRVRQPSSGTIR